MSAPEVLAGQALTGLRAEGVMNLLPAIHGQGAAGLAIRVVGVRGQGPAGARAQRLGLADGFAAGSAGLGDLPEERPEDQAQIPAALAGMGSFLLLGEAPGSNPVTKEQLELVDRGAAPQATH